MEVQEHRNIRKKEITNLFMLNNCESPEHKNCVQIFAVLGMN